MLNQTETYRICALFTGLPLGDPLGADLDSGLAEGLDHLESIDSEDGGRLTGVAEQKC